jgi:xanthine dehydrogenase accessory factor
MPTAQMAQLIGYQVAVIDDRPEWNNDERFPNAERILEPYEDVLFDFETRPDDALLIITRGHDFDQLILEALIDRDVAYLGMIGSNTKVTKAVKKLQARGVDGALIDRLHAPIGLSIGALTPEEIAVAIMAEIVQSLRRGGRA